MPADRSAGNEYRGIRRIQQACVNCRRKKAKCSGERPVCGYCKRLSQDCEYLPNSSHNRTTPDPQSIQGINNNAIPNDTENLSTRVASIEAKLDGLLDMLTSYLPELVDRNHQTPTSSLPSGVGHTAAATSASGPEHLDIVMESSPQHHHSASSDSPSWSRNAMLTSDFRPSFRVLPPPAVMNSLVDLYFARVHNQPYSFFHEQTFRQRLASKSLPDFLLFAISASAVRFSSEAYYGDAIAEAIKSYANESWKLIVSVWFGPESDPDIYICQAMTMLSIIDFTAGRRHPGWLKIGLSIRVAQDLQLMMEPSQDLPFTEQEERRRVFWSIYVLDKLCSCGRARPAALADAHSFLQLPSHELTFRNGEWEKTLTLEQAFSATEVSLENLSDLALMVLTASVLGRCAQHSIHQNLRGESNLPPWDSKSLFATINSILFRLESKFELGGSAGEIIQQKCHPTGQVVDMQLAGPIIFSRALFRTCQCLLHHPLLLHQQSRISGTKVPPSFWARAVQTCRENACSISELLQEIQEADHPVVYSFIGYCATLAASIHSFDLVDLDMTVQQKASRYFESNKTYLKALSRHWKNAEWMLLILDNLAKQSPLSATLLTATPNWELFDGNQLEIIWASTDYNTMSRAPQETIPPAAAILSSPWESNTILEGFGLNHSAAPQQQHIGGGSRQEAYGSYYDPMAFTGISPFSSFFDGGGASFGG